MKNIVSYFERIGKDTLVGVLCIAAAALLFFSPGALLYTALKIAGGLIIATAVIRFIRLVKISSGTLPSVSVLNAVLLFALGMIFVGMPGGTLRFIFAAIGVYLIASTLLQAIKLLVVPNSARGVLWWADVILVTAVFLLGVWLVLSPGGAGRVTEIVAGISLAVKGAELLFSAARNGKSKEKKDKSGDIETDFVDKSDEI